VGKREMRGKLHKAECSKFGLRRMRWEGQVESVGGKKNAYNNLPRKPEDWRIHMCRCEYNIKTYLKERAWEVVNSITLFRIGYQ
jgi:hypothetical protein